MQIKTLHYQYNATCKSKHYTTIKTTNIMQHANQNITLHKNYQYNATCKIKTLHYYKNYQYNATCKSKHYTTIKTTNIMQHAK